MRLLHLPSNLAAFKQTEKAHLIVYRQVPCERSQSCHLGSVPNNAQLNFRPIPKPSCESMKQIALPLYFRHQSHIQKAERPALVLSRTRKWLKLAIDQVWSPNPFS